MSFSNFVEVYQNQISISNFLFISFIFVFISIDKKQMIVNIDSEKDNAHFINVGFIGKLSANLILEIAKWHVFDIFFHFQTQ